MRKFAMVVGVVALALSLGLVQAKPTPTAAAPVDVRAELAKLTATNLDPNSGFCRKMLYGCTRGNQAACDNFARLCEG